MNTPTTSIVKTLGGFIEALEWVVEDGPDLPILMDGESGLGFGSWRGNYNDVTLWHGSTSLAVASETLSLGWGSYRNPTQIEELPPANTVCELLAVARRVAAGGELEGYKGDLFSMQHYSLLWADAYGTCPGYRVLDVRFNSKDAIIDRIEVGW